MRKSSHHVVPGHCRLIGRGEWYRKDHNRFSEAFNLVLHDRLFTKLISSGVDSRVDVWLRELLVGRAESVRVGGQLSGKSKYIQVCHKGVFGAH